MSEGPRPAVAVVEDVDVPNAVGAYWGEVNTTVHKALGLDGALTNGVMRDLGDLSRWVPGYCRVGRPQPRLRPCGRFAQGARVFDLDIAEGDLVHADRHGAVVIPTDILGDLAAAIETLFRAEKCILEPARKGPMSFAEFEAAWAAFERART